jgi:hypothetical protein
MAEQAHLDTTEVTPVPASAPPVKEPKLDPQRLLDPNIHGKWMRELHHIVIDADTTSQNMLELLQKDVDRVIREISISILTPNEPHHNVDEKIQKFDKAVAELRQLQEVLQQQMTRVYSVSESLAKI